uniref:NADH-ubiquinone oxidoreductase chain 6 n=1 Tax=Platystomos albinus TaxID=197009 RepID=J9PJ30_PLAAL|nr:NADH dehydrogenase subunit 6 [Platystomos albinus]ARH54582.1 NADH dehydrogenase subunit 6 [Platystomos albinus]
MLFSLILTFSIMFIFLNHPLSLGFTLLIQTILIALFSGLMNSNFWFSYILFLILIGGMMILFIYMTSIASNEKFSFNFNITLIFIIILFTVMVIDWNVNFLTIQNFPMNYSSSSLDLSLNKYINSYNIITFNLIINYLLITLIAVVNITKLMSGPLRQMS